MLDRVKEFIKEHNLITEQPIICAVSGGVDSAVRYVAGDSEDKSVEGFAQEVATGTIGGFIL